MNANDLSAPIPVGHELRAVVQPSGLPGLEWGAAASAPGRASLERQQAIFQRYRAEPRDWLFRLGLEEPAPELTPSLCFFHRFAARFISKLSLTPELEELRGSVRLELSEAEVAEFLDLLPPLDGGEYLDGAALTALWAGLHDSFARQLAGFTGPVADFLHAFRPELHLAGRVYFHLVENKSGAAPFAFMATYSTRLNESGQSKHLPLKFALQEYRDDQEKLLKLLVTVQQAAGRSRLLANLLESGELFHPLAWSPAEAYAFLREIPLYEESGILCRIPNWWGKGARASLKLSVGAKPPAQLGMAALLDFRPILQLGGEELSPEEARRLLAESTGLAFLKNRWVAVDSERLAEALAAYERAQKLAERQGLTMLEAMRLLLNPQKLLGGGAATEELVGISHGQWLGEVLERLRRPAALAPVQPDRRFTARLRPYQAAGLNWLNFLDQLGFGGCLADDMGLGKTVQVLAFFNVLTATARKKKSRLQPSLLVLPASLLANWAAEIERFFPALRYGLAHPQARPELRLSEGEAARLADLDLVITTYGLVQRYEWLRQTEWHYLILDEAQAIKNPGAKQTRAVKALAAAHRLILTGTPVENHLADLWSLFDFVNPGLLGTAQEFGGFAKKLAAGDDRGGYGKLRQLIRPFILRRMKSDKAIISDLPDKVEMKAWAELSRKQVVVYKELVARLAESLEAAEGIQRKGLVLAALLKFKQLCNHPDQYAGLDGYAEAESGKFARLREICETIQEKRERVLVFSQFREMTAPLARFLESIFGRPGLVLHGGVAVAKRKGIVEQFQAADYTPFLVLTVKAGGVGLNLTEANHVIHFDRWWNPAVENQATDRAFRIGQTRKVMVHKFLTRGTIEEKIDALLEKKARLADEVIGQGGGENWLTELDNQELLNMVQLEL